MIEPGVTLGCLHFANYAHAGSGPLMVRLLKSDDRVAKTKDWANLPKAPAPPSGEEETRWRYGNLQPARQRNRRRTLAALCAPAGCTSGR